MFPGFCWQQWCTSLYSGEKGKHQICSLVSGSGFGSVFLPGNGKDHTGVYWRDCILAGPLAGSIYSGDRFRHDRILKERKSAAKIAALALCAVLIVISGKGIYQAGNYHLVHNYQKVPDEVAGICEMVKKTQATPFFCWRRIIISVICPGI